MRRFLAALAVGGLLLAPSTDTHAQAIGFKLGASFAKISIDPERTDVDIGNLTGFAGGGFIRFGFGRIGIQPEILTVTKGFDADRAGDNVGFKLKLEYVEIPVLVHLPLTTGASFAPYVFAGPAFSFEVGCEATDSTGTDDCDEAGGIDERASTDIGITAGGGFAFAMGPGAVLIEGRYTWGTTNLLKNDPDDTWKNRVGMIMAGYSIPIGSR